MAASGGYQTRVAPGYGSTVYGQRINQIVPNSPAFHAGLEPGDIILDANGTPMDSREDLIAAIQNSQGYLEMKVVDRNTGGIQWVVAQTDPQNTNPVYSTQTNRNRNGFQGGNSEASRNNRSFKSRLQPFPIASEPRPRHLGWPPPARSSHSLNIATGRALAGRALTGRELTGRARLPPSRTPNPNPQRKAPQAAPSNGRGRLFLIEDRGARRNPVRHDSARRRAQRRRRTARSMLAKPKISPPAGSGTAWTA